MSQQTETPGIDSTEQRLLTEVNRAFDARKNALASNPFCKTSIAKAVGVSRMTVYRYERVVKRIERLETQIPSHSTLLELKRLHAQRLRERDELVRNLAQQVQALSLELLDFQERSGPQRRKTRIVDIQLMRPPSEAS